MLIPWSELHGRVGELRSLGPFDVGDERGTLRSSSALVRLPLAVPAPPGLWPDPRPELETARERAARLARERRTFTDDGDPLERWLAGVPERLPLQWIVLLQAGATALCVLEDAEPVATKSFKRYVIRGNGKAQPKHLETKGKSKYGSRLRLQNAKRQLEETASRLAAFRDEFGAPEQLFLSAPKPLWASLLAVRPAPPVADLEIVRIPFDVRVPTTEVARDVARRLTSTVVERL